MKAHIIFLIIVKECVKLLKTCEAFGFREINISLC